MNDFDPSLTPAAPPPTSRERLEAALSAIVDQYGPSLFFEPDRLKAYLDGACPDAPKGIALVLAALTEDVPQQLLAAHSDADLATLLPRLVKRLIERSMFDATSATWVVRAWTHALALPTTGLDGAARVVRSMPSSAVDFASIVTPMSGRKPSTLPPPPVVSTQAFVAPVQPEATPPPMDIGLRMQAASEPPVMPEAAPSTKTIEDFADPAPAFETPLAQEDIATEPRPEAIEVDATSTSPSLAAPVEFVAPVVEEAATPEPEPAAMAAAPAIAEPIAEPIVLAPAPVAEVRVPTPIVVPVARGPVPPATIGVIPTKPRSSRGRAIAIGLAVVVAVIAVVAYSMLGGTPSANDEAVTVARNEPAAVASPPLPDRPSAATGVTATEAPPPVAPQPDAVAPPEKAVDTTAGGASPPPLVTVSQTPVEPAPTPTPTPAMVAAPAPNDAPAPAISPASTKIAAPLSTISRIDVPRAAPGRPVVLAIHVDPASSGDVALVERRFVEGTMPMRSTPVASLERSRSGALLYPLDAGDRAAAGTMQFTLVDRQGRRGPARRVALHPETGASQSAAAECTRATCGSVVAVREAGRAYETIIRMDDRSIHTVAQSSRWRTGARVRMNGSQFALVAADRR